MPTFKDDINNHSIHNGVLLLQGEECVVTAVLEQHHLLKKIAIGVFRKLYRGGRRGGRERKRRERERRGGKKERGRGGKGGRGRGERERRGGRERERREGEEGIVTKRSGMQTSTKTRNSTWLCSQLVM